MDEIDLETMFVCRCEDCGKAHEPPPRGWACPDCGGEIDFVPEDE